MERLRKIIVEALSRIGEDVLEGRISPFPNPIYPHAPQPPFSIKINREDRQKGTTDKKEEAKN